jgi:hypothetical protein
LADAICDASDANTEVHLSIGTNVMRWGKDEWKNECRVVFRQSRQWGYIVWSRFILWKKQIERQSRERDPKITPTPPKAEPVQHMTRWVTNECRFVFRQSRQWGNIMGNRCLPAIVLRKGRERWRTRKAPPNHHVSRGLKIKHSIK